VNYLQLCETVRRECGIQGPEFIDVSGVAGDYARIAGWVRAADAAIQSRWADWDFLWGSGSFNTVAGTALYPLSTIGISDLGLWQMDRFRRNYSSASGGRLYQEAYRTWLEVLSMGPQTNGEPLYVVRRPDNALLLHPIPDAVYSIAYEYYKAPPALTTNTSTSPIPTQYERVIVALAKLYAGHWMTSTGNPAGAGLAQLAAAEYAEWLPKLEAHSLRTDKSRIESTSDSPMTVVPE
jgi:hypothetical protein